jgi:hypothetical protein
MKKWTIISALVAGAIGTLALSTRAEALPTQSREATYYSDATLTEEVGYQVLLSCYYPWGQQPVQGIKTNYKTIYTESCN